MEEAAEAVSVEVVGVLAAVVVEEAVGALVAALECIDHPIGTIAIVPTMGPGIMGPDTTVVDTMEAEDVITEEAEELDSLSFSLLFCSLWRWWLLQS